MKPTLRKVFWYWQVSRWFPVADGHKCLVYYRFREWKDALEFVLGTAQTITWEAFWHEYY